MHAYTIYITQQGRKIEFIGVARNSIAAGMLALPHLREGLPFSLTVKPREVRI